MLIGSLVELHVGLHSCLCFSHLEKLFLKASSIPPRYLPVCRASSAFSYRNPDISSTPGGLIENASASLIASRHLLDRSRMLLPPRQLLDTCWIDRDSDLVSDPRHLLNTYICRRPFSRHLPRQMSRHLSTPFDTFICRDLLVHYLSSLCDPKLISLDLSLDTSLISLPNSLISLQ